MWFSVSRPRVGEGGANPRRFYYGWLIAAACFLITMTLAEAFWAFGVFFNPLEREFGWSRAVVSSAFTAMVLGYSLSAYASGRLADRYGPRPVLTAGGILAGIGFVLCSRAADIWQLRLYMVVVGLGAGSAWPVSAATITRWFVRKRGLMLGLMGAGTGAGTVIFVPLTNYFVSQFGWRMAFTLTGIIYGAVIVSAASVLVHSPERRGLRPYGVAEVEEDDPPGQPSRPESGLATATTAVGLSIGSAMRTAALWSLLAVLVMQQFPTQIVQVHLIPFALDKGLSATIAAVAMGLLGVATIPGRILGGAAADRIGWNKAFGYSMVALGMVILLLLVMNSAWMLYFFVLWYGFFNGTRVPAQVGIMGYFFGTRSLGELIGLTQTLTLPFGAMAPYVAGWIYDVSGSYNLVFLIMFAMAVLVGISFLFIKPPKETPASLLAP